MIKRVAPETKWVVYRMRSHLCSAKPWRAFGPQSMQFTTWRQAYDYAYAKAGQNRG